MSGIIHKVKEALSPEKNTPEAVAANYGNNDNGRSNDGTGITGSHHHTGVDSRIDSGRGTEGYGSHTAGLSGAGVGHNSTTGGTTGARSDRDTYGNTSSTGAGLSGTGAGHNSTIGGMTGARSDRDTYGNTSSTGTGLRSDNYDTTTGTSGAAIGHHSHHKHDNTTSSTIGSGLGASRDNYDNSSTGVRSSGVGSGRDPATGTTIGSGHHTTGTGVGSSRRDNYDGTTDTSSGGLIGTESRITGDHHHKHHGHGEDIVHGGAHHTATANRLDPAVADSGALPFGGSTTGTSDRTGALGASGRGDYDNTASGRTGALGASGRGDYDNSTTTGTGSAIGSGRDTTAGPHNSNLMNKLDPRVDSDRDGKNALGGTNTYGSSNTGSRNTDTYGSRDTNIGSSIHDGTQLDAAKHRPSEFAAVLGDPEIQHDDHTHNRSGRHGSISEHTKYGSGVQ
ncbi:hypothetical protein MMC30_005880 [Trapelia coarctata]|nr:hypothetical protein [Trapelia coarctata]